MITFNMASFLFLLFPVSVLAHGFVGSVTIDGTTYEGNIPGGTTNPSVIRQVSTIDPVKGATNPSLNCGMNATEASDVANANPSSQILIYWVGGSTGDSNWPHNVGPIMHYMTKCSSSCSSYDSANAEWFKISELGLETSDTWYLANLAAGEPANVTIPSNIQPGDYLLRSEIISLQLATSVGGAEFYPACIQLSIGGSGTGAPQSNEVCQFPGCYTDTEAGIYTPNIYDPPINYTFPGPPVAAFVNGSSDSGSSSGPGTPSTVATTSLFQTCKLVSRSNPTCIVVK
ncbi:glycoside hydrolase family 61 protein [Pisolithus tinctorius]|uniref:lytic cellulose monooxygenase (C4-dehydrogenating) n=1 Tax=Pisolithus tinctorius Marx 270 TaxID=870435 RepID=A0A0C3P0J2_PISTI|nr:glycoside hydrolase family 61 protein [Pisolithus tinctorius]KIO06615.1 glycoside hydrolase family 61 protein [Pisolithus tinctorius Marx 270]